MLKTIIFDLGNVILFFSHAKMMAQVAQCMGLSEEEAQRFFFGTNLRELYEKGTINTEQLAHRLQEKARRPFTLSELNQALSDIFTPNTALWPLIEELKQKGLRLILLSNTCESHFDYALSHYPVLRLFDHHVLSYKIGAWKPDPPIYLKALSLSGCQPSECFYTDDIPEFIAAARKLGLPGEVFTDVSRLKAHIKKAEELTMRPLRKSPK